MGKVLLVDDDPDLRALVEARLRGLGHRVVSAGSGEAAMDVLTEKGAPDVAILDVLLPGMSGLELMTLIRRQESLAAIPVIFLSGRVLESDIEAGRALGATYLTKPVVISALAAAIDRALAPVHSGDDW